jgi:hypothetical protein
MNVTTCHCERSAAIQFRGIVAVALFFLSIVSTATAKYSGGSGTAQDPYEIATAADLIALGETWADCDKHFVLTADIDLDPRLAGRKVFDKAVISSFGGVFDGNGHTISHLTIKGNDYLGLFGALAYYYGGEVRHLGVVDANITGSGNYVGGLVGDNRGTVTQCYSTGTVSGYGYVGGLVGCNDVSGWIATSYSSGSVTGTWTVGGLVGCNYGDMTLCYSTGTVSGDWPVGGLVGNNGNEDELPPNGSVTDCYASGSVSGKDCVGGLVGDDRGGIAASFWDTQTSGQTKSPGGTGKTTAEMQEIQTYRDAGWDFWAAIEDGTSEIWHMPEGGGYPVLAVFNGHTPPRLRGMGTPQDPYVIADALELGALIYYSPYTHYRLANSIDLSGIRWRTAAVPWFAGVFDGNGHTISHLTITGKECLGLFAQLRDTGEVKDLGLVDANITGFGDGIGGLVGHNGFWSTQGAIVTQCYSTARVSGNSFVGGLVGSGSAIRCYSTGRVNGTGSFVGGLVGSGRALYSVWDTETCGVGGSAGGVGLTTVEMMDPYMLGLNGFANDPNWVLDAGHDYPRLAWEGKPGRIIPPPRIDWLQGHGTVEDPYRVDTAEQLIFLGRASALCNGCFFLAADIDLDPSLPGRQLFRTPVIPVFTGLFDGSGHTLSHLAIQGGSYVGLFGQLAPGAKVKNLGVVDVNVSGTGSFVGALVGSNSDWHTQGAIVTQCYSSGTVSGRGDVGGLVGSNDGTVTQCYSTGTVSGVSFVGGLVGINYGAVTQCYSTGSVSGSSSVGGLVGVDGVDSVTTRSFWDIRTSGQTTSAGGMGKTTAEMQTAKTFLDAGWDFVGETKNGTADIWWILEGKDYPRLWWEAHN